MSTEGIKTIEAALEFADNLEKEEGRSVPSSILAKQVRSDRSEIAALTARIDALTKERDGLKADAVILDAFVELQIVKRFYEQAYAALGTNDATPKPNET